MSYARQKFCEAINGLFGDGPIEKRLAGAGMYLSLLFPDIPDMDVSLNRARNILSQLASTTSSVGQSLAASIPGARIEVPPILMRNLDNLYLLKEPTGPTCLQLIIVSLQ